jgi:hypothetical protein
MRLISIFIFLIMGSSAIGGYAQNDSLNRQKYWSLRHRLITKFVKPGLGPGESIPAAKYTLNIAWSRSPVCVIKKIEWGEATTHLGWYMGMMATELELLQRSNQSNDEYFLKLIEEIYFSLNAINRLDDAAEIVWGYAPDNCNTRIDKVEPVLWDSRTRCWLAKPGSNDQPERNGFCLRMDGNADLLEYFTDAASINTGMVRTWLWGDSLHLKKNSTNAGAFGFYTADPKEKGFEYRTNGYYPYNEISQDQIFHMLLGIVLIVEFVEEEIRYNGISLKLMAREIGLRLINQYHGMSFKNPKKPKRGLCNYGGNSFAFWQSVKKVRSYLETGKKNQIKDQVLLWGKLDCATSYPVNRGLYVVISSIANSTSQADLCKYSINNGFEWGFYTLLRQAIYNPKMNKGGCHYTLDMIKQELNLCLFRGPHCDAYEYGPAGDYVVRGNDKNKIFRDYTRQEMIDSIIPLWHFGNRFLGSCTPTSADQKIPIFQGEFNGLDYLLLYNLANIVFGMDAMGGNYTATRDLYFPQDEMIIK